MIIRGRHEWRAEPPRRPLSPLDRARVDAVYIHHTTGVQHPEIQPWLRAIQRFHQGTRRWNDIGYNYVVDRNGTVWEGRGWNVGAHASGHNSRSFGIAYLGDGSTEIPEVARVSIGTLVGRLSEDWNIQTVGGHRDIGQTACPGDWLYGWVQAGMPLPEPPRKSPVPDLREGWKRRLRRFR